MATAKEPEFDQPSQSDSYTILTLAQLYFAIDKSPSVSQFLTNAFWKVIDTISIDGAKLFKVQISWIAVVSRNILNRGYRVLAERAADQANVLLCEGNNSAAGRRKVDLYWNDIRTALQRSLVISESIPVLESREAGYYQEPTAVIAGPYSLEGQPSAEFYQTIHYATVRKRGDTKSAAGFYCNDVDKNFALHFGIAQCSIPSQKMLNNRGDLPRAKGFVSKLLESKKKRMMPMRINYINEMSELDFKSFLSKNINTCYISYLRYLHSSILCMADIICNEEDGIAIKRALVEDLSHKFYGTNNEQQLDDLHKDVEGLNDDEKGYLEMLKQFEVKLQNPPENQNEDILLYIHGFNNSVEECLLRASQIACDIGFSGRLAVFSWPSVEKSLGYFQDREQMDTAISQFVEFLLMLCNSARKVHIIAHSAANLLFTRSMMTFGTCLAEHKGKIGQVICAHADVKLDLFQHAFKGTKLMPGIEEIVDNVTIYYHQQDKMLWLSGDSKIGTGSRLGRQDKEQLPSQAKLDNVSIGEKDVSKENSLGFFSNLSSSNHNVYAENPLILEDMSEIINEGLKAYQRKNIRVLCKCGKSKSHDVSIKSTCDICNSQYNFVLHSYCEWKV